GPTATITKGRGGKELTDFAALQEAGAVAFTDDGDGVEDDALMLAAFQQAERLGVVLIQHCEYKALSAGGVMHLGDVSHRINLPGLDPRSEEAMIERDVDFCRRTGARYHIAHISTGRGVEFVRRAKQEGLPVTAEVCTHHLLLTDEACAKRDPNTKMHPPLRPQSDVDACRQGLLDGTIDCIVTDHAPHTSEEKARGFVEAPPGIVGLETALGVATRVMIASGLAGWYELVGWFSAGPRRVLNAARGGIDVGVTADLTLIDPLCHWIVDPQRFCSKSRNTPFGGFEFTGRAAGTIRGSRICPATHGWGSRFRDNPRPAV
ncbi:MAG: dihydroorotase, partial [Phycisphaerales bacterium]